jgi:hypothetical protein
MDKNLISMLCILGAAVGFFLVWAAFRFFIPVEQERNYMEVFPEQAVYMREQRLRHVNDLAAMMGRKEMMRETVHSL